MSNEEAIERLPYGRHLVVIERPLAEDGRVAGCEKHPVPFAQGNLEPLREIEHHLAARARTTSFDETQVAS